MDANEVSRPFVENGAYHCNAGAFVIAANEVQLQPDPAGLGSRSLAPVRVVGKSGRVGVVTLMPDLINSLQMSVFSFELMNPADATVLNQLKNLKFCPVA